VARATCTPVSYAYGNWADKKTKKSNARTKHSIQNIDPFIFVKFYRCDRWDRVARRPSRLVVVVVVVAAAAAM